MQLKIFLKAMIWERVKGKGYIAVFKKYLQYIPDRFINARNLQIKYPAQEDIIKILTQPIFFNIKFPEFGFREFDIG